ncbi:hypothetical protein KY290_000786 [Solanum tuberosum]|uniref:Retrotransposon gag domain-containing protein n=1 Tax=Solanum tuberosum TaxID=4113 RepID=A0ABQ7WKF9_SOLTU|nr:hypothetical protein KY290_000786 [Solanum tuberosum]
MEDQIVRTIKDSIKVMKDIWSKDLAEIRSMLHELVGNLPTSKPSTLKFQRFCGENSEFWISQAEQYFDFYEIAENHKLSLASYYLDGAALTWYQWLFQNKQLVDWEHFAAKVLIRFRKRHLKLQVGRLANLWQVPTVTKYPSPCEAISPGFSEPDILSSCLAYVHPQRSDISNSLLPQNFDEKSEYPTKTDAHKMFDKMLNNCPNVFTLAPFDDQIEMSDEDDIDLDISEIQQFHGSPQRDMSERYVTTISLDSGSPKQQIEFVSFEDMYLLDFLSEHETKSLLLLGSIDTFCFIAYVNCMTQVWDPGRRWCMHFSILLSNLPGTIIVSLQFNYNYTHLKMNTRNKDWEKNSRGLFAFPSQCMNLKFDASLESRRMTHPTLSLASFVQSLRSLADFPTSLAEDGSSPMMHNYWTCYFTRPLTDFFTDSLISSPYHEVEKFHREGIALVYPCVIARQTKKISRGQIALEMVLVFDPEGGTFDVPILEDMDGVLLKISKAITNLSICNMPLSADKHDHQLTLKVLINLISFLLYWDFSMANPLDGQNREMYNTIAQAQRLKCDVKFAILRAMYAYVHTKWLTAVELVRLVSIATAALTNSGLRSIEEQPVEHEGPTTDVITGGVACVIHLGNLESSKGTGVDLSVLKVSNSWFHSNTKAVDLDSPSSLDRFAIVMSRWLHSNLEDKVHFEGGSIVVNQADFVRAYGLLEAFIWDPGPITMC